MECPSEEALLELVDGTDAAHAPALRAHVESCAACGELLGILAAQSDEQGEKPLAAQPSADTLAPTLAAGALIGRYVVLHRLGSGGMGVVYAGFDPELQRKVAIKLLRPESVAALGAEGNARILREAQSLARLAHPNIVAVFDVGLVDEQVYVAMEYIEGQTVAAWLQSGRRTRAEILQVFLQAGEGLATAHEAGIVHRDFKPDNVLVGADGRVRVIDFGLSRDPSPAQAAGETRIASAGSLTRTGAVLGTPAYMAPEQLAGKPADARSDLFSFCVALHESLFGVRPFAGDSLETIARAIAEQQIRFTNSPVPEWIKRALRSGLNADPRDRPASMKLLLARLSNDPARARRIWVASIAGLLLLALSGFLLVRTARRAGECRGAEARLAGIWDPAQRETIRNSILATKLPYADAAWNTVSKAFDRYAAEWTAMRTEACQATVLRGEQSPELLDLRMACLDDRLHGLSAAAQLFSKSDNDVVTHAVAIAGTLQSLAGCADARALRDLTAPTAEQKPQVDALQQRVATMNIQLYAGHEQQTVDSGEQLLAQARELRFPPIEARVLLLLGTARYFAGQDEAGIQTLHEAQAAALRARDDRTLARACINLIDANDYAGHMQEASRAELLATAAVERVGDDAELHARLELERSVLATSAGDPRAALRHSEEALVWARKVPDNIPLMRMVLDELGGRQNQNIQFHQALQTLEESFNLTVSHYGSEHAASVRAERALAEVETGIRTLDARKRLQHAISVSERTQGPDSGDVANGLIGLGNAFVRDDPAQALAAAERAAPYFRSRPGEYQAEKLAGRALQQLGRFDEAKQRLENALAIAKRADPRPSSPRVIYLSRDIAALLIDMGKLQEARLLLEAVRAAEETSKDRAAESAGTAYGFGLLEAKEGRYEEARREFEHAIEGARTNGADAFRSIDRELALAEVELHDSPHAAFARLTRISALPPPEAEFDDLVDRDRAHFLLAKALLAVNADPARDLESARHLAEQARDGYAARGASFAKQREAVAKWLETNGRAARRADEVRVK